jgi:hypothetical protein
MSEGMLMLLKLELTGLFALEAGSEALVLFQSLYDSRKKLRKYTATAENVTNSTAITMAATAPPERPSSDAGGEEAAGC